MLLVNITFTIEFTGSDHFTFSYIDLVYPVYSMIWLWSMCMQYFEYKRGLPHAWYCHILFWGLSFVSQTAIIVILVIDG